MTLPLVTGTLVYVTSHRNPPSFPKMPFIWRNTNPDDIHYKKWVAPGGGYDEKRGDRTMEDCAIREVSEETGIKLASWELRPRGIVHFQNEGRLKPDGNPFSVSYDCSIFSAYTEKRRTRTHGNGKNDKIKDWEARKVLSMPCVHTCDRYLWLALTECPRGKKFEITVKYTGKEMSHLDIDWI